MKEYYYSPSRKGFFSYSMKSDYDNSPNGWPDDAIALDDDYYYSLIKGQEKGKSIVPDSSGYPVLVDPPPPSKEELISIDENKKKKLMKECSDIIAPLQDAVDLDIATDEEKTKLISWKKYRVYLNRVDTSNAPDTEWPSKPY